MKFNRDPKFLQARAEAYKTQKENPSTGINGDFLFTKAVQNYKVRDGDNVVRIVPPMWDEAMFPWYEAWVHGFIGPNNSSFFCLAKMKNQPCPICEARSKEESKGASREDLQQLTASHRALAYVIDRMEKDTDKMLKLWSMPWTVAQDIVKISFKRTGELLYLDDPDTGYDILFDKTGLGRKTKYTGVRKDDDPTPLHADKATGEKWLTVAEEHNIPKLIKWPEYNRMKAVLSGEEAEPEAEKETKPLTSSVARKPAPKKPEPVVEEAPAADTLDELTAAILASMTREQLTKLCADRGLETDPDQWKDQEAEDLAMVIAMELGIVE